MLSAVHRALIRFLLLTSGWCTIVRPNACWRYAALIDSRCTDLILWRHLASEACKVLKLTDYGHPLTITARSERRIRVATLGAERGNQSFPKLSTRITQRNCNARPIRSGRWGESRAASRALSARTRQLTP